MCLAFYSFFSRPDSNVCIRKAALKSARSGLGVLLRCGMEGRERIAAIHKVDVSCSFPVSRVTGRVTISYWLKHRKPGTVSLQSPQPTSIGNRFVLKSWSSLTPKQPHRWDEVYGVGTCYTMMWYQGHWWALGETLLKIWFRREVGCPLETWQWETWEMHSWCQRCVLEIQSRTKAKLAGTLHSGKDEGEGLQLW